MKDCKLYFVMLMLSCFFPCIAFSEEFKCVTDTLPDSATPDSIKYAMPIKLDSRNLYSTFGSVNNNPDMSGFVDGHSAKFIMDTGASKTSLSEDAIVNLGIRDCKPADESLAANGIAKFCKFKIARIRFGAIECFSVNVNLPINKRGVSLIGNDILSRLKITMQNGLMTIYP